MFQFTDNYTHLPKCTPTLKMKLSQSDNGYSLIFRVERIFKKSVRTLNFVPELRWQEFKPPLLFQDQIFFVWKFIKVRTALC